VTFRSLAATAESWHHSMAHDVQLCSIQAILCGFVWPRGMHYFQVPACKPSKGPGRTSDFGTESIRNFRTIGNFCSAAESTLTLQGPASLAALEVQSVAFTQCCKAASYMSEMYRNVRLQQICGCRLLVRLFELGANKLHHLPEPCKHVSCCVKCGYTRLFSAKIVKV
jgi:predicted nucleic-acid-binding Zn-ribbon protein